MNCATPQRKRTCKNRQSPTALIPLLTPTLANFSELWRTEQTDIFAIFLTWRPSANVDEHVAWGSTLPNRG